MGAHAQHIKKRALLRAVGHPSHYSCLPLTCAHQSQFNYQQGMLVSAYSHSPVPHTGVVPAGDDMSQIPELSLARSRYYSLGHHQLVPYVWRLPALRTFHLTCYFRRHLLCTLSPSVDCCGSKRSASRRRIDTFAYCERPLILLRPRGSVLQIELQRSFPGCYAVRVPSPRAKCK